MSIDSSRQILKESWYLMELSDKKYCTILKTNINVTNMQDTIAYLSDNLEELRGQYICVSNVHTTVMAYRDEEYRNVQNSAAMALPDGKPLSIVSKRRGFIEAGRVPGPDLMPKMFELSETKGYRHYFYGSTEETLEKLKIQLQKKYPYLQIAGMYSPLFRPLTEDEDKEIIDKINEAKPDFVWVALGAPKQERWMYDHKDKINGVMLGVGAAFDFEAGTVKRAPHWMQELCLEWLYRIMQDPKRLIFRYLDTNFSFIWNTSKETREMRRQRKKNRKLKVAMIGHKRIPSREGGVEVVVEELSTRLTEQGYEVEAYNRSGYHVSGKDFGNSRKKYYNGIRIIIIPTFKNGKLNAIVYSTLATLRALFGGYDVIHYHAEGPCATLFIPKLFGIRVVATIHGLDWQRAKWGNFASKVLKFGEKMAAKHADEVIVLSKNVQQYFLDTYGRETHFIPNGISRPVKRDVNVIKEKYGLEKDSYILFLARLVPEKGLHYLIEAFEAIQTDKRLVIAGGSSHSVAYMKQMQEIAAKDERIIMTDFVQGRVLEELYSNAYLFVLPSDIEGMALTLLESMSYGNCCLASDIKENTEVVEDHAVSFRQGDVADLKEKLEYLLSHPENVKEYKEQSADFICSKYNWEDVVARTEILYASKKGKKNEGTDCK